MEIEDEDSPPETQASDDPNPKTKRSDSAEHPHSIDEFVIRDLLGKGGFGEVRKALHKKTNTMRAIKII